MSTQDNPENRALEALIVSRLRAGCGEQAEPEKLPSLSEKEKASLKCLKPGFVQKLLESAGDRAHEEEPEGPAEMNEVGNRELVHGMNRAEEIDEVTEAELRRRREEIQKKMQEERERGRDGESG